MNSSVPGVRPVLVVRLFVCSSDHRELDSACTVVVAVFTGLGQLSLALSSSFGALQEESEELVTTSLLLLARGRALCVSDANHRHPERRCHVHGKH